MITAWTLPIVFIALAASRQMATKEADMSKNNLYVERRPQGDYAVRKPGSERASAVEATQAQAIQRARELNPNAAVHVERVRNTSAGSPDKWRKA